MIDYENSKSHVDTAADTVVIVVVAYTDPTRGSHCVIYGC